MKHLILSLIPAVMISAASAVDFDGRMADIHLLDRAALSAMQVPAAKPAQPKEWTVMVFLNGKNNIGSFAFQDVNEMETVGSSDKVNVVAELGEMAKDSAAGTEYNWTGSRRYFITKDSDTKKINSPMLQEFKDVDMGDWTHLVDFVQWAKSNYPAKHYMLVIWNHGSGWKKPISHMRGISYDDETSNNITTPQLAKALEKAGGVDIYASDACLMQMIEVSYEIRGNARYVLGSEEAEWSDGYNYNYFLTALTGKPQAAADEVGRMACDAFYRHYTETKQPATISLVDPQTLPGLIPLLNKWTALVMSAKEIPVLVDAKDAPPIFFDKDSKDLISFVRTVDEETGVTAIKTAGDEIINYVSSKSVLYNKVTDPGYKRAQGLAIYVPADFLPEYMSSYDTLAFSRDSDWDAFAKWYAPIVRANSKQ